MYGGLLMIDSRTEVSCFWVRVAELLESSIWQRGFQVYTGVFIHSIGPIGVASDYIKLDWAWTLGLIKEPDSSRNRQVS
jgi:hypothetical protein